MEPPMQLRQKYIKILSRVIPMGTAGAALLLGSSLPTAAAERPTTSAEAPVSERLAAIREAAFIVMGPEAMSRIPDENFQLTWGNRWNNRGWGRRGWSRPRWNNWRNAFPRWNNFWRNW